MTEAVEAVEAGAGEVSWAQEVEAVTGFWRGLGLPGLLDVHTHFLPDNIQRRVWAQFDEAGPKIGRPWPIRYRGSVEERVEQLRELGVRRFSTLPYAHRPGIADYLNDWAAQFKQQVPESVWSATFYPEPEAGAYVSAGIEAGVEIFKVHVQVGEFDLDDPLLDPVWGLLAEAGTPVVVHAGHAPVGNDFTGPAPMARVLAAHPRLRLVVAHLGAPDYLDFLALAERYDRVHLDTTMVFTDFWPTTYPDELLVRLADRGDRILLGTDFPTIPYPYSHQLEGLARLDLGDDWLRAVCWHNAAALLGAPA
ncbi:amidohydrolase family protein [Nocardioides sp. SOB44]|uniref:Amidohydrolase family protein n=1 Tax=Nocardioides cremeus TaxID=3058044 RepID=A0ABT8TL40_9ACTN|nr:amidohydrolase family protein [Nocardioides cremeus]MDO3394685.1 amidohydrolase family protein [Nocardioides cremeus]